MSRGLCVFDLDNTLGDFRVVDFFGLVYEPKVISGFMTKKSDKDFLKKMINLYSNEEFDLLEELRDTFEKKIRDKKLDEGVLRPELKTILKPLVDEYKKHRILGFIIYSNNGNLYSLEYASRAIQNMFHTPKLFLKLLDRYDPLRDKYDGSPDGARSKMVATVKQIVPNLEDKNLLFMDDLVHNDFFTTIDSTYVLVPGYESSIPDERLEELWSSFEQIFNSLDVQKQKLFFNLYHIKHYLKIDSLNDLKSQYMNYSKLPKTRKPFNENLEMIQEKISSYITKLPKVGGRRKTRKYRLVKVKRTRYV